MSRYLTCTLLAAKMLLLAAALHAQDAAAVTWNLTANTSVSTTVGNVVGRTERFSFSSTDSNLNLQVRDYAATGGGQRLNLGQKTWPYDSLEQTGRYVQFGVAPSPGMIFHVATISLDLGAGGTGAMNANVYYSTDSLFGTRTRLNPTSVLPNSAWLTPSPSYTVNVDVSTNQAFYLRFTPWYNSTNASTSKYLYLRNLVISGSTFVDGGTYLPTVTTAPVSGIMATAALCGGLVTWDGGAAVTARGVCWNTVGSPTVNDHRTLDGSGIGSFTSALSGLSEGVFFFVRAYATNSVGTSYGDQVTFTAHDPAAPQLAFPGAEGFGKYTVGGRGGVVLEVTNLNDSGPGSLRAAIQASGSRTIVFRVSGTIVLNSDLKITNPFVTIAGQTAPGDGICLRKYPLVIDASQVIVRYVRSRLGDESGGESDALWGRWQKNIIIDHCSASWSEDETLSIYWCDSLTVQWCLISESLYNSNHPKGAHGYGGIWGGSNSTYHHNLLAHHSSRNPRFASGSGNTDFRNNVIYNWGFNSAYGGEAHDSSWASPASTINMVANYYKPGPATKSGVLYRIINPSTRNGLLDYGKWFVTDNTVNGYPSATADNWTYGVQGPSASDKTQIRSDLPFAYIPINQQTAEEAYQSVLGQAGAIRPMRDSIDERIVREVRNGTATFEGATYRINQGFPASAPITGIIDSQSDVGGWPTLHSVAPPIDTDHDGMPDAWEAAHGLNPLDPGDRNIIGEGGYTNLELYLNGPELLTGAVEQIRGSDDYRLYPSYPNPFNPSTALEFSVPHDVSATLNIHNILGQRVAALYCDIAKAGMRYRVTFDAHELASGVYFAVLEAAGRRLTQRMMLLR